jgi:aminoglycoside phosphotransferase (APT) family kinase protein
VVAPHPWAAEEEVTPELATRLIEAQFPALAPARVALLGVGWDNTAYRVNDDLVFRFPRREIAVPLLETEARLLPAVAPRLPLPVPVPIHLGRPGPDYRWPFAGYRFLEGQTACRARLDDRDRLAAAEPLGQFLAALHAVPVDDMVALGASGDSIGRLDLTTRVPRALEVMARIPRDALGVDPRLLQNQIESSAAIRAPAAHVLAHGDLYVRHLLIDPQRRLCGVIDWGDLHIGNPAVDLAVAHGFLPPTARSAFMRAYARRVPAPTWFLARFRAIFSALCLLDYSRHTADPMLEEEARLSLQHATAGG